MKFKKTVALGLSAAMIASSMSCIAVMAESESDDKTITISLQAEVGKEEGWEAVAEGYKELHPDVNIVIDLKAADGYDQWVQNVFTTEGSNADIVHTNLAGDAANGKIINFSDYLDNESPYSDGTWSEQFEIGKQKRTGAEASIKELNLEYTQVLWLYNQEIFDEVGVDVPTTWSELEDACAKLMEAGYQPIAMPGDYDSFYSGTMGWLAQNYTDQTERSILDEVRAQEGDYCYDPDIDGTFKLDITDPFNDTSDKVTVNRVRLFKAIKDGDLRGDSEGMKTVWENFAEVFPKYAGGDAMFGTDADGAKALFYQGKAAMMVNGGWGIPQFINDMKALESGETVEDSNGNAITDMKAFTLGTFNMPSMEGDGIEAPARTIEIANGTLGAVSKNQAHDDLVVDFLMYYSSQEGMTKFLNAAIEAGYAPSGASLVYGVEYPEEYQSAFGGLEFIGNTQNGYSSILARGISENAENYRNFYDYSYKYLNGEISIDEWLADHQQNIMDHLESSMEESGISDTDLENPANMPTGE